MASGQSSHHWDHAGPNTLGDWQLLVELAWFEPPIPGRNQEIAARRGEQLLREHRRPVTVNLPSRLHDIDEPLLLFEWLFSGDGRRENRASLSPDRTFVLPPTPSGPWSSRG